MNQHPPLKMYSPIWPALAAAILVLAARADAVDLLWTNTAGGNWNVAGNWTPNQVPGTTDNAFITNSGTYTVTVPVNTTVGSFTLGGAAGTQTLANGTVLTPNFTLNGACVVNPNGQLVLAAGILNGAGNLTVDGAFLWTGGTMSGAGVTTIGNRGTLTISPAGTATLSGRTLNNAGLTLWTAGNFSLGSSAVFSNLAGATFTTTHDGANTLGGGGGTPIFANAGLFRKTGGFSASVINPRFVNTGTTDVQVATLRLSGGGTNTGSFTIATGATLEFISGAYTLNAGSGVGGAGSVTFGGPVAAGGDLSVSGLNTISGALTFTPGATMTAGSLTLLTGGTLGGTNTVNVSGQTILNGGALSGGGAVNANGGLTINGNVTLNGRNLNNAGTGTWDAGILSAGTGAVFNNLAGATFDLTFDGHNNATVAPAATFANAGLFRKTGGALVAGAVINAQFNNSGTLEVQTGTLHLDGGGTQTGTINNLAGGTLDFGGGSHVMAANALATGAGDVSVSAGTLAASGTFDVSGSTLNVNGGTANFSGAYNVTGTTLNLSGGAANFNSTGSLAVLNISSGTLGGTSTLAVTGLLNWSGGVMAGPGAVNANGGIAITGNVALNGGTLNNAADALWTFGNFNANNGAVFSNLVGATLTTTFDGNNNWTAGTAPTWVNAGIFRKTGGTLNTTIDAQFLNTGLIEVQTGTLRYGPNQQTAGLTLLNGGGLDAQAQPIQFLGGSLMGTGLVTVANTQNVINSAAISPGLPLGQLNIAGNYQQTASGALNIELGGYSAGTTFDLVTVTGGGAGGVLATLGGSLNVTLTNGFYPTNGAIFTFLTVSSRSGQFASFHYPSNDIGLTLSYDATSASIKVTNLKPVVANPIAAPAPITYGAVFNDFQFPANTFTDPDNNPLSYTASGMPPGITFTGATRTFSGTPTQAGSFPVAVAATDNGTPNLTVTNIFTITINPAALSVTADAKTKPYGAVDPAFTASYVGFVNGETNTALGGTLTFVRAPGTNVGSYLITPGGLTSTNYAITFNTGTLTITNAPLSITADAKSKPYGAVDPVFTASYAGFVNGETNSALAGTLTFVRAPGTNVGSYLITPGGLTSTNYAITFNTGTLTITNAPLSVTADAKTKPYGAVDPVFTASYAGFVNGETATVLGGTLVVTRAPGESVGSYLITPGGQTSGNYAIAFNTGTLTITAPAPSILPLTRFGTTNLLIIWSAVSNGTYRVQYNPALATTNWTDLTGDVIATNSTASATDILTSSNRFYRVKVLP